MKAKDYFFYGLGITIVVGFFTVLIIMMFIGTTQETINLLVGALIGAFLSVVGYVFGSSSGSADKAEASRLASIQKEQDYLKLMELNKELEAKLLLMSTK